jgi:hypothetical protein
VVWPPSPNDHPIEEGEAEDVGLGASHRRPLAPNPSDAFAVKHRHERPRALVLQSALRARLITISDGETVVSFPSTVPVMVPPEMRAFFKVTDAGSSGFIAHGGYF